MKFVRNINLKQRIQIVVISLLILLFTAAAITIYSFTSKRVLNSTYTQMEVYLEKLSELILEVNKRTGDGFTHQDYASLKPYFNKPAFFSTDFPFLVDHKGSYIIHLYKEGQRFPREHLNTMFSNLNNQGTFEYQQTIHNKTQRIVVFYKKVEFHNSFIGIPVSINEVKKDLNKNRSILILIVILGISVFALAINFVLKPVINTITKINANISKMAKGDVVEKIQHYSHDEVGQIARSLNALIDGISKTAKFANDIGNYKLDTDYTPLGPNDALGNALISMRESLKQAAKEESKRKKEDEQRNWVNSGLAEFGDILRQNNSNLQALSDNITQNIVNYLNANQGGLFIANDEQGEDPQLHLQSAFAYNRKKFVEKTILFGEGLVGNCAVEKSTIHLKEIPDDYIEITSGLGEATPRSLLIVPLKLEDKVFGVIEIASFNEFLPHEIDFVEKIGENIASTLSAVKNSIKTTQLLEQSQQQKEEMSAQEEEMRQNMEEMQATQEEMARKTVEMEGMTNAINEAMIFCELSSEGRFLFANLNFMERMGYMKSDLEGKTLTDIIHPNELNSYREAWNTVINGETYKGTLKWANRMDEELFVLCSITPAYDENNDIYKIFLLGQDATDSKKIEMMAQRQAEEIEKNLIELQSEQALAQKREEEMRALLLALDKTCLITEIDKDGVITFINNKNVETLGDSKDQIVGQQHSKLDFEARTNPKKYHDFWNNLLAGNSQQRDFSLNVKGRMVWISEYYTPIKNNEGDVEKIITIGIDISDSKNKEQQMQKQIDDLMQQLRKI